MSQGSTFRHALKGLVPNALFQDMYTANIYLKWYRSYDNFKKLET